MKGKCIIVRHGDYKKIKYGDGPLTDDGRAIVTETATSIGDTLKMISEQWIDLAIVSGAMRCQDTYSVLVKKLFEMGIMIETTDIHQKYFATHKEKKKWKEVLSNQQFHADGKEIGEREAVMKHLPFVVHACVDRIVNRIRQQQNAKTILVVTHGPHDAILAEQLTDKQYIGLKKSEGRIIEF